MLRYKASVSSTHAWLLWKWDVKIPQHLKGVGKSCCPTHIPTFLSAKALIAFTLRTVCPKYHCSMRSDLEIQEDQQENITSEITKH